MAAQAIFLYVILAAAAARTKQIRLTSAVTVLSAADPLRVFQSFVTLDLISQGRAEMVVGRGSFTKAFPLWLGVGGTLELPLMVAVIGGETHRFRPLVDLYREMRRQAGRSADKLKVGVQ